MATYGSPEHMVKQGYGSDTAVTFDQGYVPCGGVWHLVKPG
jgi:hypothetical protein